MQNGGYSAPHHDAHPVDFHGKEGQIAGFFDSKIHGGFGDNTQFSGFDLGGARFRSVIPLILYSPFYKRALAQAKYYLVLFVGVTYSQFKLQTYLTHFCRSALPDLSGHFPHEFPHVA